MRPKRLHVEQEDMKASEPSSPPTQVLNGLAKATIPSELRGSMGIKTLPAVGPYFMRMLGCGPSVFY